MSNRSEQPQRIKGGLHEALQQGIVPVGTSEETKELLNSCGFGGKLKCPRCTQSDIELKWGKELEDHRGWFERIATCRICKHYWCCAFLAPENLIITDIPAPTPSTKPCVIDGGANEYISGVCPYCGFTTEQSSKHEELLIHHISIEHPNERIPIDNPSGQVTQEKIAAASAYRCVFCAFASPTAEMLADHLKTVHREEIAGEQRIVGRKMAREHQPEDRFERAYTKAEVETAIRNGYLSFLSTFGVNPMSSGWSKEIFEGLIVHILKVLTKEGE